MGKPCNVNDLAKAIAIAAKSHGEVREVFLMLTQLAWRLRFLLPMMVGTILLLLDLRMEVELGVDFTHDEAELLDEEDEVSSQSEYHIF